MVWEVALEPVGMVWEVFQSLQEWHGRFLELYMGWEFALKPQSMTWSVASASARGHSYSLGGCSVACTYGMECCLRTWTGGKGVVLDFVHIA
jgi:hypothetical protein